MNDAATPPATGDRRPWHAVRPRALACAGAIIAVIGATALTGCSAAPSPAAGPKFAAAPTATATPVSDSTVPSSAATSAAAATRPASAPATPSTAPASAAAPQAPAGSSPAVPVLGRLAGLFAQGAGFGQVKPAKIFNGGDPTGLVTQLTWSSWGGAKATGSGMSDYVGPGQSVATGTQQPVTVVAFNLGTCHGTLMYRAVEWYFAGEGQTFSPGKYENICAGHYVPNP